MLFAPFLFQWWRHRHLCPPPLLVLPALWCRGIAAGKWPPQGILEGIRTHGQKGDPLGGDLFSPKIPFFIFVCQKIGERGGSKVNDYD